MLVVVRGHLSCRRFQDYDVEEDGVICRSMTDPKILQYATFSKIRVLAYDGSKWIIDPQVDAVKEHWKLRVFEKKPLIRLQWDPGEFWWKDPFDRLEKGVVFFSTQLRLDDTFWQLNAGPHHEVVNFGPIKGSHPNS